MRHLLIPVMMIFLIGLATPATAQWTEWFDRDRPSGKGDYETLSALIDEGHDICGNSTPVNIQCQTLDGMDYSTTGEIYSCTPQRGGFCVNADQPDGECMDYRVRFSCGDDLEITAATPMVQFGCSRNPTVTAKVTLDYQGGADPYTCTGLAGNLPLVTTANQCVAVGVNVGTTPFTVTDSSGASRNVSVTIEDVIESSVSVNPASCCTCADGSATVSSVGKNGALTYRWNPPLDVIGQTVTDVLPGTYQVLVTDSFGCFRAVDVEIGC